MIKPILRIYYEKRARKIERRLYGHRQERVETYGIPLGIGAITESDLELITKQQEAQNGRKDRV